MENVPKVMIMGAGSIGLYLAGALIIGREKERKTGKEGQLEEMVVSVLGRERVGKALEGEGILVTDLEGGGKEGRRIVKEDFGVVEMGGLESEESRRKAGEHNIFLVCVKSSDTLQIAQLLSLLPLSSPHPCYVISCQNGMKNADILRENLPPHFVVLSAVVGFNVIWDTITHIHRATTNPLILEPPPFPPSSSSAPLPPSLSSLFSTLNKGSCQTKWARRGGEGGKGGGIEAVKWGKLCLNLNNGINGLYGKGLREEMGEEGFRDLLVLSIHEALEVLGKNNIEVIGVTLHPRLVCYLLSFPQSLIFPLLPFVMKIDPEAKSSMLWDLRNGRKTEIDELQGKIIELGKKRGVPTPVNEGIFRLIKEAEEKKNGPPNLTPEQIFDKIPVKTCREPLFNYKGAFYVLLIIICWVFVLVWFLL